MQQEKLTTGIERLDDILGGGLLPGKITLVYGATGVGKSVLGTTVAHAGIAAEGSPGILIDASNDFDDQSHALYAGEFFGWELRNWADAESANVELTAEELDTHAYTNAKWSTLFASGGHSGEALNGFMRHHLPQTRRVVVDGASEHAAFGDALKLFGLLNYVEIEDRHQDTNIIDNQTYWQSVVDGADIDRYLEGRDSRFRFGHKSRPGKPKPNNGFRGGLPAYVWDAEKLAVVGGEGKHAINARREEVDFGEKATLLLKTTDERNIFSLVNRGIGELDAHVNTVIAMGYYPVTEENPVQRRGFAVLKHRGSAYDPAIATYVIGESGISFGE